MAQTILEIYDEIIAEKNTMSALNAFQPNIDSSQNLLQDLTSSAKVAVWRSMFFVMAVAIWSVQVLFDEHKAWIEQKALEIIPGGLKWYQQIALSFQYGDTLQWINGKYQYATISQANRIIKLVAVNEISGQLLIKVAKLDVNGDPIPLTSPELTAFIQYMQFMKFAGVIVTNVSRPADLLRTSYRVYIDPLKLTPSGELISSPGVFPVEDAIKNYCKNLPFNGVFSTTELTDKIQSAEGVIDPVHETSSAQYGANPFIGLGDYYIPNGGYLRIDPAFPLSTSITYIV